ncbi:MAG: lysophospholipid acyltransferase family protein [Granulosicoccus sp.]|nr:lysophospholipid acyltransferase family protein [Granulosicoccus sp.]
MSVQLLRILSRMLSWLPLRTNQAVGAALGHLAWRLSSRQRHITEVNLKLCFPDMSDAERHELAHQSLMQTGRQLTECAWIWHRPVQQTLDRIVEVRGQALLDEARASGKGIIMVSPHVGNWELCLLPLSRQSEFTYFYRSPRQPGMDDLLVGWRAHLGGKPAALTASGIREGLKILKSGGTVGILPDQEPDRQNGVFVTFFNHPALTMTLLSRLAHRSGAHVLFCVAERLPAGRGWRFHILPAEEAISSEDLSIATAALNRGVETCIALCPAQYLWDYKRFNTPEDGSRRPYA